MSSTVRGALIGAVAALVASSIAAYPAYKTFELQLKQVREAEAEAKSNVELYNRMVEQGPLKFVKELGQLIMSAAEVGLENGPSEPVVNARAIVGARNRLRKNLKRIQEYLNSEIDLLEAELAEPQPDPDELLKTIQVLKQQWPTNELLIAGELNKLLTELMAIEPVARPALPPHELREVPELVGKSVAEARQILEAEGFRIVLEAREYSTEPPGTVIGQEPNAGTRHRAGSEVKLVASRAVKATNLLVIVDASKSMQGTERKLEEQLAQLRALGTLTEERPAGGFGVSTTGGSYNLLKQLEEGLQVNPNVDAVYVFSDFQYIDESLDGSNDAGYQRLRELIGERRIRLYLGTVRHPPSKELLEVARESGGGMIERK